MPKITPFLWFDDQAQQAAEFYVSVFPNSRIEQISRYGETGPRPRTERPPVLPASRKRQRERALSYHGVSHCGTLRG